MNDNVNRQSDKNAGDGFTIRISSRGAVVFGTVALLIAVTVSAVVLKVLRPASGDTPRGAAATNKDPDHVRQAPAPREMPPWGELVIYNIEVEKPDEYLTPNIDTNRPARWFFGPATPQQAAGVLSSAGVPEDQVRRLTVPPACQAASNGLWITPGVDLILGLKTDVRQKLYPFLGQFPENHYQHFPFCFRQDAFDRWFEHCDLSETTVALVKRLLYKRGTALCFSDLNEVLIQVPDMEERRRLLKTLSRQATVLMKLRVRPETDVSRLLQYWWKGTRSKDVRPLLDSLTKLPDGATLDVVHLLPPFARRRLYTYPYPPVSAADVGQDCHWTTMNFFNETPDDRFLNKEQCGQVMRSDYYQVTGPPSFGDVVMFLDAEGVAVHSAVYVADGIVFTKNGSSHLQPWTLMKLDDLLASYPVDRPLQVSVFRNKKW